MPTKTKRSIVLIWTLGAARHPGRCLATMLALGLLSTLLVSSLRFDSSWLALIPSDAPEVQEMKVFEEQVGGSTELILAVSGPQPARLPFARRLVSRLRRSKQIVQADVEFPVDFFESRGLLLLPVDRLEELRRELEQALTRAKARANPLIVDLTDEDPWEGVKQLARQEREASKIKRTLTSPDGKYLFIVVRPRGFQAELGKAGEIIRSIEAAVALEGPAASRLEVQLAGRMMVIVDEHRLLRRDMRAATLLALVLVVLLLTLWTRKIWTIVIVGTPLVLGVVITLAASRLIVGQLNLLSGFMLPVLVGLGIDFSIHLYLRYLDELRRGETRESAMQQAIVSTLRPCMIGGTTTAAAFFALVVCDYRGISEFGLLAGVGVLITLAVTFLTLPPLAIFLAGRVKQTARGEPATRLQVSPLLAAGILLCVVAFAGLSASLAPGLRFHNDLKKMREGSEVEAFYDEVTAAMGGPLDPTIVLVDDVKQARIVERAVQEQLRAAGGERPDEIGRVLSIASLVPDKTGRKLPILARIEQLVRKARRGPLKKRDREQLDELLSLARARPWSVDEIPESIRRRFESLDGHKTFVLLWPRRFLNTDEEIDRWVARIERLREKLWRSGVEVTVLDEKRVLSRVTSVIRADVPPMMAVAALTVLLILAIHFRGIGRVVLVYGALALGVLSMLGLMALFEMDLTMFNVIVLPMVVGIGIDNAVHILHGYDTLGRGSVAQVVETVGRAALLASATTAIGFGAIVVAHQHGIKMLGVLAVLGVCAVFTATTIALPALLSLLERLRGAPPAQRCG